MESIKFNIIIWIVLSIIALNFSYYILYKESKKAGYIEACEDFYKGKLKYDFVKKQDGTKIWVKIAE